MRYTEARLSRYGQLLIQNIKKDTVKFISNFDESEVEPTILPTLLPNLLINGSSGIAAGYATNIPPFNPTEVIDAVITRMDSPNCFLSSILKVMPGPDFPTGAFILNPEEIKKAYETGKGKLTLRANIIRKTQKLIHITEIPFETCKSSIIKSIRELSIKYESLRISEVNDESDRNGLCISIETRPDSNFDFIKNFLLKNTQLQITYSINMIAIQNRKPCLLPMLNLLDSFIEHIDNITTSVAKFDLKKAQSRQDIVKGLIKAIKILDDVVNLIRHSTDKASAKDQLIKKLMFNENQAEAIVTLRLYRLSNNDVSELNKELLALDEEISILLLILNNKEYRNSFIKNKLREYKKIFTSPRKSKILNEDSKIEIDLNDTIEDRDTIVVVTKDGYIKNIPRKSYFATEYNELKLKDGDIPVAQFNSNLRDKVVLITSDGNYISIPNHKIEMSK
jgi:topoisomerase-4 subunit A